MRALNVLKSVDVILAEDTRTSGKLLKHYDIDTKVQSYHMHNEHKVVDGLCDQMEKGLRYALVSDAGTPGISDPGFLLARACVERDLKIECLPGATAFVPALVKSGLPCDKFVYEGFLPHKKGKQTVLKAIAEEDRTVVCYESPHRILKTLGQIAEIMGEDRIVSVSRELTKVFEETKTGPVSEVLSYFETSPAKGEIVLVIKGK